MDCYTVLKSDVLEAYNDGGNAQKKSVLKAGLKLPKKFEHSHAVRKSHFGKWLEGSLKQKVQSCPVRQQLSEIYAQEKRPHK